MLYLVVLTLESVDEFLHVTFPTTVDQQLS